MLGEGTLLEVGLGMLLEVGEVAVGRPSSHMHYPGVGKGMAGKDMLLEAEEQKGKPGSHLVGNLL